MSVTVFIAFLFLCNILVTHATNSTRMTPIKVPVSNIMTSEIKQDNSTSLSIVSATSNEITPNRLTTLLDDEELVIAGRDSFKIFMKSLRANRSIDESLTLAITAFATTRTANRIKDKQIKNAKFALDREAFGKAMTSEI